MRSIAYLFLIICSCYGLSSCSVRRFIPEGERIYKGASASVTKAAEVKESNKSLRTTILQAAVPRKNRFLLGHPYKVWWWYKIGYSGKEKGLRSLLRRKLGEPPVFASRVNTKSTAENMESLMTNLGYFRSTVQGDTTNVSYFTKAKYTAQIAPRYSLGKIEWVNDSTDLLKMISENSSKEGFLKSGDPYTLSTFSAEYDRIDLHLKKNGYYYFNPSYLYAYVDSSVGDRKVDILLYLKKVAPQKAKQVFSVNEITMYPNYSLDNARPDTLLHERILSDGIHVHDSSNRFKPSLFGKVVTYRPGDIYNSQEHNATLNRLINLGVFKFVKSRYEEVKDSTKNEFNVFYYLTPLPKKSLTAQIDGFTKENNYTGTELSVSWRNRNAFRGAEQLGVRVYGGLETTTGDSLRNSNYRLGTELTLKVPRYVIPFINIKENKFYPPSTNFLLGYEYFVRDILYTKNLFRFNTAFTWKNNIQNEFTLAPISISYLSVTGVTDSFRKQLVQNPALQLNVFPEVSIGSFFNYTYNSGLKSTKNKWYISTGIDLSGNILGALTGAKNYREKKVFGTPFAQYVKLDFDVHYTRVLNDKKVSLANRIQIGLGMPYNNSRILPYGKLYTIGGASSLRGFRSRSLGPGTHRPSAIDQRFFQIIGGDYKLLANTELRIPISSIISAATFIDAGNIWTKDTLLFGPAGKFTKDFMKEIAVSTGVGLRFDATILLIRADLGIPLRKPYLPEGQRWDTNFQFGSSAWRRENLIFNIAIGLPF